MTRHESSHFGDNKAERHFISLARKAGFDVLRPVPIRCEKAVLDRHGVAVKVVTTPDCRVVHQPTSRIIHVEVTQGSGDWSSKAAQRRVVEQASQEQHEIIPYCVVTGKELHDLSSIDEILQIHHYLLWFFGWSDLIQF